MDEAIAAFNSIHKHIMKKYPRACMSELACQGTCQPRVLPTYLRHGSQFRNKAVDQLRIVPYTYSNRFTLTRIYALSQ